MGLRDAGKLKDVAVVTIKDPDPMTNIAFKNADGTPMTVTLLSPYSKAFKKAKREMDRKMAEDEQVREAGANADERIETYLRQNMAHYIESWEITLDTGKDAKKVPFSFETALGVFEEFPWLYEQLEREISRTGNFLDRPQTD